MFGFLSQDIGLIEVLLSEHLAVYGENPWLQEKSKG